MWAKQQIAALLIACLAFPLSGLADTFQLQDGQTISGSMKRTGDTFVITADDGSTTTTQLQDIARITLTATPEEQAAVDWNTLNAGVARADDIQTVISLYQQYVDRNPQSPHAAEARTALAQYQNLAPQNPAKFRGRWLPAAQIPTLLQQWTDQAAPALNSYKAGDMSGACAAAQSALTIDPQNSNALEIAGLAALHMNRLTDAAHFFQTLTSSDPGNGLAWHNLAVIDTLQNRQAQALSDDQYALAALPANRLVLDNIAGLLATCKGDRNTAAYQNLSRQYAQSESRAAATMAADGLFRYGATWIPQSLLTQYAGQDAQISVALAQVAMADQRPLDDQSAAALTRYRTELLAIQSAHADFAPRPMDLGQDIAPPPPLALASLTPLPPMPQLTDATSVAIAQPTTSNDQSDANDQPTYPDDSQPTYDDSSDSSVPVNSTYTPTRVNHDRHDRNDSPSPATPNPAPSAPPANRLPSPPPMLLTPRPPAMITPPPVEVQPAPPPISHGPVLAPETPLKR